MSLSSVSKNSALFTPVSLGEIQLANRVVMAPLTRFRSGASGVPGDLLVEHYRQRASVGLIITEGTYPVAGSRVSVGQPGIATDEQGAGWRRVTEAVHSRGGRIVMQLMHCGRATHPDTNDGLRVVAPSPVALPGRAHTPQGTPPFPVPHALTAEEARATVDGFVDAARRAVGAGMDGVELHGANGFLLHQFLSPATNRRTDEYGGSPHARARFAVEAVTAVADAVGAGRVGLRISPESSSLDVLEPDRDDVLATYGALVDQLRPLGLAYLSVLHEEPAGDLVRELRRRFGGPLIANSGPASATTREEAAHLIDAAHADAVAVGRALIANPDLVERWQGAHPENGPRPELFYGADAEGYNDYPFLTAG
ncbi:alkene reductase [Streptomyces roseirectus]|uniref:Alkene reductase n=1 Tax=Streptomyces roseirectus TaxID=2768066 RepID=A0A7H0IPI3_9ACTN|nr:alkene reductase [Streptomyces roseirectus]QNP74699.1 alkene reductase [Streptomyces roseirectus]